MPRYLQSLAKSPYLYQEHLVVQGVRLVKALDYMHGKGYIHMDVKSDNIFMDAAGNLFLGDFGSACKENERITSTTPTFYHRDLIGEPAHPQYDWYMLLVTLLIEFDGKEGWSDRLIGNDLNHKHVNDELVMREADKYLSSTSSELKELLDDLRTKCNDNLKSES